MVDGVERRPNVESFNGDGNLDVIGPTGSQTQSQPHLFLGRGDGTLIAPMTVVATPVGRSAVISFDVNGDGVADLLTSTLNGVSVQLGHGDGTFDQQTQLLVTGDGSWVAAAQLAGYAVGDLNGTAGRPGQARQPCRDLDYRLGAPQQRRWDVRGEPRAGRSKPRLRGPGGSPPQWRSRPRRCAGRHS